MGLDLQQELLNYFGFDKFKGSQKEVIESVLEGNNTFVLMPTGGGKSLCYQLPALIQEGTAIVISPLIALMKNQVDAIRGYSSHDRIAHFLNSSLSKSAVQKVKADILEGHTKLLYVAPESLTKPDNIEFLKEMNISFYAIDEAHCISEWGHDFRPEYRRIKPIIEEIGIAPIIALTATATPKVQYDIQKNLGMSGARVFKSSFNRPNLYYDIRSKTKATEQIIKFVKERPGRSGIVYCLSRKKVEELAETLQINGVKALAYHAGMDSTARSSSQDRFLMEDVDVIVATIAFGMGIDKPDVRYVIHHDVPKSLEGYYQETGRAGRDGGEGHCVTFYSYKDIQKLEKFMQGKPVAEQEIGQQLLFDTVAYVESALCRRVMLLYYFGEKFETENCGCCDNCRNPKELIEGKDSVALALQSIVDSKQQYKTEHLVEVLIGGTTSSIKLFHHDKLEVYGKGSEFEDRFWKAVFRQGIIAGFIKKDIENYGVLKITEDGLAYLANPYSFKVVRNHNYEAIDTDSNTTPERSNLAGDVELYSLLKDLCKKEARRVSLPPYILFQETSLKDMSIQYPITLDEMCSISGVGNGKASKYGKPFVKLIKSYVEEKGIERAQDMVVKSVVNKSKNKVYIIKSIDMKKKFEDIAAAKGLEMLDLLAEMEVIVNSGTKIDISYYLDEVLDEDHIDDIFDFLKEDSDTGSLEELIEEFGNEMSEAEIRMVRIKFISELGN